MAAFSIKAALNCLLFFFNTYLVIPVLFFYIVAHKSWIYRPGFIHIYEQELFFTPNKKMNVY